jgi:hypothetical protein
MDWLFDNIQILFLIGIAVASWLKSRSDQKKAGQEEDDSPLPDWIPEEILKPRRPPPLTKSGVPPGLPGAPKPPPIFEPAVVPPIPIDEQALARQREIQEKLAAAKAAKQAAAKLVKDNKAAKEKASSAPPSSLRDALRDPAQTRRAIVLREILGTPVGLR